MNREQRRGAKPTRTVRVRDIFAVVLLPEVALSFVESWAEWCTLQGNPPPETSRKYIAKFRELVDDGEAVLSPEVCRDLIRGLLAEYDASILHQTPTDRVRGAAECARVALERLS